MHHTVKLALNAALNTHYQQNKIEELNENEIEYKNDALGLSSNKKVMEILIFIPNSLVKCCVDMN